MAAYYNEHDPFAAEWLRNLISAGHIAPGDVDERDIQDVRPDELRAYTQCHFFAGIGVWSHSLRKAGWPDSRPVWTGSCPCQPFSAAGKGGGFDDERHLWPAFFHLIEQCAPRVVFGEQVASKDGLAWLDLVQADLEGAGYAVGAFDLCAAGFGAPHIRQRLYWVADAGLRQSEQYAGQRTGSRETSCGRASGRVAGRGDACGLAYADPSQRRTDATGGHERDGNDARRPQGAGDVEGRGEPRVVGVAPSGGRERLGDQPAHVKLVQTVSNTGQLAYADGGNAGAERQQRSGQHGLEPQDASLGDSGSPGPTNGVWRDADWLLCRDGKGRPVRPGSFPLAHGAASRVGRLRAYGNAIVAEQAAQFIQAVNEIDVGVNP